MNVRRGYELIETPPADEPLMVGDCLEFTWKIYQSGEYYWSVMAHRLEQACEADGRLRLVGYDYRWVGDTKTISFEIQILSNNVAQTDIPVFGASLGTVGIILVVCVAFLAGFILKKVDGMYPRTGRVEVARWKRGKAIVDDPDLSDAEKVEQFKEVLEEPAVAEPGFLGSVGDITGDMVLIVLVVLAIVFLGTIKGVLK